MRIREAFRFLTVLPLPGGAARSPRDVAGAVVYFAPVGAALGLALGLLDRLLLLALSPRLSAVIVTLGWAALTGGLHLDGLADTADGLFGGRTPERRLEIMRDSRLGTYGALALVGLVLLKVSLLAEVPGPWRLRGLVLAGVLGRWAMAHAIVTHAPARVEGLGRFFREHTTSGDLVWASLLGLALAVAAGGLWALPALALSAGVAALVNRWALRRIGGLTGDTYGALCEVVEACVLGVALAAGIVG